MRAAWESCRHSAHDVSAGGGSPIRSAEHVGTVRSPHISPHRRQVVEWCDLCEKSTAAVMHSSRRSPHPRRTAALGSNQLESRLRSGMAERMSVQPARRRQPQRLRRRDQRAGVSAGRAGGSGEQLSSLRSVADRRTHRLHGSRQSRSTNASGGCARANFEFGLDRFLLLRVGLKRRVGGDAKKDSLLSFNRRCCT